jgi:hypothetical protein
MKNWKDYVGFQPRVENKKVFGENGNFVFVLRVIKNEENALSITIEKQHILAEEYKYTKDEVGSVVETILSEFPKWEKWLDADEENVKKWFYGFGSYSKIVDGDRIHLKNYIQLNIPWYRKDEVDNEKRQYIKELKKDSKKLSDEEFESKHNIPKDDAKWLIENHPTFGVIPFRIPLPYIYRESKQDELDFYNYCRIGNEIAKQSRRGFGKSKVRIENLTSVFYQGSTPYDVPVFVHEFEGKYAVIKHPDFEKYGFVVNLNEND